MIFVHKQCIGDDTIDPPVSVLDQSQRLRVKVV